MGDKQRVGVALICADVTSNGPIGTHIDIQNVKNTLKELKYATFTIPAPTSKAIMEILRIMSSGYSYPDHIRSIVVYFACHGGIVSGKGCVYDVDGEKVLINENGIVSLFKPTNAKAIGDRKCLFFFDCCLVSSQENEQEPQSCTATQQMLIPAYLPKEGKHLIAYATSKRSVATGDDKSGGIWTSTLFNNIANYDLPITVILDKTCEEVAKKSLEDGRVVQNPYYVSSLGTFFFRG